MVQIDLDPDERARLAEILEGTLSDLRMEISHTDQKDFRDMLKRRKEVLQKVLDALGRGAGEGAEGA